MNRKNSKFIFRTAAALLLISVSAFAFIWTRSSASEQIDKSVRVENAIRNQKTIHESQRSVAGQTPQAVALKAEKRGFPLMNLRDGKKFETQFVGADGARESLGAARALGMTNADLNGDGAADLLIGYAAGNGDGGHLAVYRGSLDTLWATAPQVAEGFREGRFPDPFLPEANLIKLPAAPDFIGTGDFNRDGANDIVTAASGDDKLFLLLGNEAGEFKISSFELPGRVTAMMTGMIDPLDNQFDIAGLQRRNGCFRRTA